MVAGCSDPVETPTADTGVDAEVGSPQGDVDVEVGPPDGCVDDDDCDDPDTTCHDNTCIVATCDDGLPSGEQTDVDCGGPNCPPCDDGMGCREHDDCISGICQDATLTFSRRDGA